MLWASGGLAHTCRWMEMGVLGWLILELTDSPWQVALVGVFRSAPMLAFGLFSGLIADRLSRWRVMCITQTVGALVTALLLVSLLTGVMQPWQVFLGAFILGWGTILDFPSRRSFMYDLVGPQHLVGAMSLETVSSTLGKFLGPLLGGLFLELTGFQGVYVLLLAAYVMAVLLLTHVRASIPRPLTLAQPIWQSLASGLRYSLDNRVVTGVLCTTIIMNALGFSYVQLLPVVAKEHLRVGPGLMGMLASAEGIGTLIGAMTIACLGKIHQHGRIFILGALLELVSLVAFALSSQYHLSLALLLVAGVGNAGFGTMQSTIILLSTAPGMRGRALGIMGLCIGATPLGLLEMGALAALLHAPAAIGLNAVAALLLLLPVIMLTPLLSSAPSPTESIGARIRPPLPSGEGGGEGSASPEPTRSCPHP
ncbi:MAG: MFS transporter [Nitrospinae bacterium]|nr:MFS transporter [Nitrospinota bacterium]